MHKEPLTPEQKQELGDVVLVEHDRISAIWLVPLVAALVGLYIVYKSIVEAGIPIQIEFDSGEGIEAGKTHILLKGIRVGSVEKIEVNEELDGVQVTAIMDRRTASILKEDTLFWLVQPQISLSGISGLDALISGNYIALRPGSSEEDSARKFVALPQAPPLDENSPGLHIVLETEEIGSISLGTNIYYRKIPVGEVQNFELTQDGKGVRLQVHIQERFSHLVKSNSRFWNSSGISVNGSLSGIKVETESLASIISGGISFYTPEGSEGLPCENGDHFELHSNFSDAEAGIQVSIYFASGVGLVEGSTQVKYNGIQVGELKKLELAQADETINTGGTKHYQGVWATVQFDPNLEKLINSSTQFWLVKPRVSLAGVSGLDTVVSGPYIDMLVQGQGSPQYSFNALSMPPNQSINTPGLKLLLTAETLGSINIGTKVYYRKIPVGEVENYLLNDAGDGVDLHIHIEERFAHLVNKNSRFWNSSGLSISGGLSGINVKTESLAAVMAGGISFYTPGATNNKAGLATQLNDTKNRLSFPLHSDFEAAEAGVMVTVVFDSGIGLSEGNTKVKLDGVDVGILKRFEVIDDFTAVKATLLLTPEVGNFLNESSAFWLEKPRLSLAEVKGLDTLLTGPYINVLMGNRNAKKKHDFIALEKAPRKEKQVAGLQLELRSPELGSIALGSPVFYRQLQVGQVNDYRLQPDGKGLLIDIGIDERYSYLVTEDTRFWNASGISVTGGLAGVKIRTESLLSMVAGGIAFDNFASKQSPSVKDGHIFTLYSDRDVARNVGIEIAIDFQHGDGLGEGTQIKYKGVVIGRVDRVAVNPAYDGVTVYATIDSQFNTLLRAGSIIWVVRPEFGLAGASNLGTLLSGEHIEIQPGQGELARHFVGSNDSPFAPQVEGQKIVGANGLHIILKSDRLGSVKKGVKVYYREIPVGEVIGYALSNNSEQVDIHILVREKYAPLVRKKSRFWNASGIGVDFGLFQGASIQTESLESILAGGISFATPNNGKMGPPAKDGEIYQLNDKVREEWLEWRPEIHLGAL